ncbi:unnamed protein product [Caenorhabditis bovis]|uniref:Major facilitator superfamily (MFS) profile domain-containing protein n=1 Tax=Caenorhabditis bovis TaxID=2654633 RepID=A0A8S1EEV4_9PELO|nr:unnamed protein product [Caenorhabditis bovis]
MVGIIFGLVTTISGIVGVFIGNLIAQALLFGWCGKTFKTRRAHSIAAGIGSLISIPCLFIVFIFGYTSEMLIWILCAIAITGLCFNWSLNVEVLNFVVAPERRSTAFSYLTSSSHLFGDASGPYIIGAISDAIQAKHPNIPEWNYKSLAYASLLSPCLMIVSTVLYFCAAVMFLRDANKLDLELKQQEENDKIDGQIAGHWDDVGDDQLSTKI